MAAPWSRPIWWISEGVIFVVVPIFWLQAYYAPLSGRVQAGEVAVGVRLDVDLVLGVQELRAVGGHAALLADHIGRRVVAAVGELAAFGAGLHGVKHGVVEGQVVAVEARAGESGQAPGP